MNNHAVKAANAALDEHVDQHLRALKRAKRVGATYRATIRATFTADVQVDQKGRIRFAGEVAGTLPQLPAVKVGAGGGVERETEAETVARISIESTGEIAYEPARGPEGGR